MALWSNLVASDEVGCVITLILTDDRTPLITLQQVCTQTPSCVGGSQWKYNRYKITALLKKVGQTSTFCSGSTQKARDRPVVSILYIYVLQRHMHILEYKHHYTAHKTWQAWWTIQCHRSWTPHGYEINNRKSMQSTTKHHVKGVVKVLQGIVCSPRQYKLTNFPKFSNAAFIRMPTCPVAPKYVAISQCPGICCNAHEDCEIEM